MLCRRYRAFAIGAGDVGREIIIQDHAHSHGTGRDRIHVRLAVHHLQHEHNGSPSSRPAAPSSIPGSSNSAAIRIRSFFELPRSPPPIPHPLTPLLGSRHTSPPP